MATAHASDVLSAALEYAARGWKVVPLHGIRDGRCECGKADCGNSAGKHPKLNEWQKQATTDENTIIGWFERWPGANVGVQFGEESGLIDIEFDDDIGRMTADKYLKECFTPSYTSGKSIHRLFKWNPSLPNQAMMKWCGLEIRIGGGKLGGQSVFPPSQHHSGLRYQWCIGLTPDDVNLLEVPEQLMIELMNDPEGIGLNTGNGHAKRPVEHWKSIVSGVNEGGRNNAMTSWFGAELREVRDLDNSESLQRVFTNGEAINAHNRPPLPAAELKTIFASICQKEAARRISEATAAMPRRAEQRAQEATKSGGGEIEGFKLVVIRSDPKQYALSHAAFDLAPNHTVTVTGPQLMRFSILNDQVVDQAEIGLPQELKKGWYNLANDLLRAAEKREAEPEEKFHAYVAEVIMRIVEKAHDIPGCEQLKDHSEHIQWPTRFDGITYVPMHHLVAECARDAGGKIERAHVTDVLRNIGALPKRARTKAGQRRYCCFDSKTMKRLTQITGYSDD